MEAGLMAMLGAQPGMKTPQARSEEHAGSIVKPQPFNGLMEQIGKRISQEEIAVARHAGQAGALPAMVVLQSAGDIHLTRQTASTLQLETSEQTGALSQSALVALLHNADMTAGISESFPAQQLDDMNAVHKELWQLVDPADTGAFSTMTGKSWIVAAVQSEAMTPLAQDGLAALQFILDEHSGNVDLLATPLEAHWQPLIEQAQQWREQWQADPEDAVPLVAFAALPMNELSALMRGQQIQKIQLVDAPGNKGLPVSAPLAEAIAADDLSMLSAAEMTELDALIDKITQQTQSKLSPGEVFKELVAERANNMQMMEQLSQPSVHSASHAQHQTRLDDATTLRFLQATPSMMADKTPAEQVQITLSQTFRGGLDRVLIQLEPADLGRVEVRLEMMADGRGSLNVMADKQETLDLLQRDARLLQQALADAGIDAEAGDMEFNLRQGQGDGEETGTENAKRNDMSDEHGLQEELVALDVLQGTADQYYALSIAQGLNIKV